MEATQGGRTTSQPSLTPIMQQLSFITCIIFVLLDPARGSIQDKGMPIEPQVNKDEVIILGDPLGKDSLEAHIPAIQIPSEYIPPTRKTALDRLRNKLAPPKQDVNAKQPTAGDAKQPLKPANIPKKVKAASPEDDLPTDPKEALMAQIKKNASKGDQEVKQEVVDAKFTAEQLKAIEAEYIRLRRKRMETYRMEL